MSGALTYRKDAIDPIALVKQVIQLFRDEFRRKDVSLAAFLPESSSPGLVFGDAERLQQLFTNLLENSLKYTQSTGKVEIHGTYNPSQLHLTFQDSAPGVPISEHEKLFNRLYRVEASRNRRTGGMGLGLTICHNIVKAHEGSISASPSPLGGLQIDIFIPIIEELQ